MASQAVEAPGSMSVLAMWPWTSCKGCASRQHFMHPTKIGTAAATFKAQHPGCVHV